jgi:hypothetical protein
MIAGCEANTRASQNMQVHEAIVKSPSFENDMRVHLRDTSAFKRSRYTTQNSAAVEKEKCFASCIPFWAGLIR